VGPREWPWSVLVAESKSWTRTTLPNTADAKRVCGTQLMHDVPESSHGRSRTGLSRSVSYRPRGRGVVGASLRQFRNGEGVMAGCQVCGNNYYLSFEV
jgi:hypothetical protein